MKKEDTWLHQAIKAGIIEVQGSGPRMGAAKYTDKFLTTKLGRDKLQKAIDMTRMK